jgi:phenylalanyl-tRNA synthetase alpha chain
VSATVTLQQLTDQLEALEAEAAEAIAAAADADALEQLRVGLLGKKGRLSGVLGAMGKLPGNERPLVGQRANVLKTQVQTLLGERLQAVKQAAMEARIAAETLDVTAPPLGVPMGHRHPLISTTEEIVDLFCGLGYQVEEGPEVETDHHNFTALNIPAVAHAHFTGTDPASGKQSTAGTHRGPRSGLPPGCGGCHPFSGVPSGGGAGHR